MTTLSNSDLFHDQLRGQFDQTSGQDGLQMVRNKAWDHFQELGLPSRHMEVYRYIKLRRLYDQSFVRSTPSDISTDDISKHILPECQGATLVFVNGHFQPELSETNGLPDKAVVSPLHKATNTFGSFLKNHWAKSMKEETDPFVTINSALFQDGAFLYLPPKTIVETPVQVIHFIDTNNTSMMMLPRLHVFAGAHSELDLVTTHVNLSGENFFLNSCLEMVIEEGARVNWTQAGGKLPENAWCFEAMRAILKRDSHLNTLNVTEGCATVRHDYHVTLKGENGEVLLNGLLMLEDKREAHTNIVIDHQAPNCRSMQLFKGVLNDYSHSSFEGKILVRQAAQQTDAFQLNNNLLLSDHANAACKPNLEIFADDVKASHGATVGQLDKEQLFYLKTRGYSDLEAKKLLVNGFCQEIIDKIQYPSIRENIDSQIKGK